MTAGIEWPLETVRHVPATPETVCRHDLSRHPAAATRSANEKNFVVFASANRTQRRAKPLSEFGIDPVVWKRLPFHCDNPLSQRR